MKITDEVTERTICVTVERSKEYIEALDRAIEGGGEVEGFEGVRAEITSANALRALADVLDEQDVALVGIELGQPRAEDWLYILRATVEVRNPDAWD